VNYEQKTETNDRRTDGHNRLR